MATNDKLLVERVEAAIIAAHNDRCDSRWDMLTKGEWTEEIAVAAILTVNSYKDSDIATKP